MELLRVDRLEDAVEKLLQYIKGIDVGLPMECDTISIAEKGFSGRILAEDIFSSENVPGFPRSVMDGYAVRATDTSGASENLPVFLRVTGEVEMGKLADKPVNPGECIYVPTGAMIPMGADAVVMVEYCEHFGTDQIAVYSGVSSGKHIVLTGDDMKKGDKLLAKGRRLRPSDAGVLAAVGRTEILAFRPWKMAIFSTGDEIVSPKVCPEPGQMRDVNSYGLVALAEEYGFQVTDCCVISDDEKQLFSAAEKAMSENDLVVISGGSSKGKKDATAKIIEKLSSRGVLTHGIAVKPGKPTITGYDEETHTVLIGLPGHPVAALMLFSEVIGRLWEEMTGQLETEEKHFVWARITSNIAASPGRRTYQLVKLLQRSDGPEGSEAIPVFGKSGMIKTLSDADGYIVIEINDEGINSGEWVKVHLL